MKHRDSRIKLVALFLAVLMLVVSTPYQPVLAAMVSTEELLDPEKIQDAREVIHQALAWEDVKQQLIAQGIDPIEAQARIDALSNAETIRLAEQIKNLPAGKGPIGFAVGVALIVFIAVLVAGILALHPPRGHWPPPRG